jgi:hypothetical protein
MTVMREAARLGISDVDAGLIAGSSWRAHPAAYAFLQMIRGWTEWQRNFVKNGKYPPPRLTIHLTPAEDSDRDVIRELDAGRLDLESLLDPQQIMLWAATPSSTSEYMWTPVTCAPDDALLETIEKLFPFQRDVDLTWKLQVEPAPCKDWKSWSIGDVHSWQQRNPGQAMSLRTFGVVPYSVLHLLPPPV